jgi:hypothetical protein
MYSEVQIMVLYNNHEFDVGMNGSVKFVETWYEGKKQWDHGIFL